MKEDRLKKVKNREGKDVEILGEIVEDGKPTGPDNWRGKLKDRKLMLKYLQTGERYWYSDDWYGSEKRKNPA
jgi:hypothetical protein